MNLENYDAVIFDLDNTIYDENEYLFFAYSEISKYCAAEYGLSERDLYEFLKSTFQSNGRTRLFNAFCEQFQLSSDLIDTFLKIMRSVTINPKLTPFPYFKPLVHQLLNNRVQIGLITNGNVDQQRNKVANLEWGDLLDKLEIVYANQFQPKPAVDAYLVIKNKMKFQNCIYVGDSETDARFCATAGIPFLDAKNLRGE